MAQAVLHVRSQRATSRRTLSDVMRLSPTTAGQYVDQLIATGHLVESGLEQGPMGRPKRSLTVHPEAGWFAGVEFYAERLQAVRIDFAGNVVLSIEQALPPEVDAERVLAAIQEALSLLTRRRGRGPLLGIGVGAPGVVDPENGVATEYAYIKDWIDIPVAQHLQTRFKAPVTLENNLRAVALAERWFGGGRSLENYVILGPRTGFGAAMVHRGQLVRGAHFASGEIGRWPWPLGGGDSSAHLQDVLSSPAVYRRLAGLTNRGRLPQDLRAALATHAHADGQEWGSVIDDFARVVGCLQLLLDASTYFLHGPLTSLGARFCEHIEARTRLLFPALRNTTFQVVGSMLHDDAGALGAASLAMEAWAPT